MPVKNIATAVIIALAGQSCLAAPGMMPNTAPAQQSGPGFWKKLWRGDDAQAAPTQPVAVGEEKRWWSPVTNNPLANAISGGGGRQETQAGQTAATPAYSSGDSLTIKGWVVKAQLAEAEQDYAGARRCFSEALTLAPNDAATLREVGHFEDRREQLALAEQMYRRALDVTPRDPALLNDLALCCARQGKLDESAGMLSTAISLRPEKVLYRNNIAKVLIELGQPEAASVHLTAAHPAGVAQYNLGQLLVAKGNTAAAANCFREAVRLDPSLTAAAEALQSVAPGGSLQVAAAPQSVQRDPAPASSWRTQEPVSAQSVEGAGAPTPISAEDFPRLLPPVRE